MPKRPAAKAKTTITRAQPVPQRTMTAMTRQAAPAQRLLRHPNPGRDPRPPRGPRRAPNNDAGRSAAPRSQLGHRPPSPPAPQAAATPHLPLLWSVLQVLSVDLRSFIRPRKTRAVPYRRRLRSSQRRGLLLITLVLSLRCVFDCASAGRLPASPRHGPYPVARDSAVRCWSGQLCAARAISSSCAIVPRGHNRRHSRRHPVWASPSLLCKSSACVVPFCMVPSLVLHWTEGARASLGDADVGQHSWLLHGAASLPLILCLCFALFLVFRWSSVRQSWSLSNAAVQRGGGRRVSHLRLMLYLCLLLIAPVSGMDPAPSGAAAPLPPQMHHKRSYGRAVRRASAQAFTFYKGKRVSYRDLTGQARPTAPCRFWPAAASHRAGARQGLNVSPSGRRLRLFCWNCGGMGDGKYAEFNHWLNTRGQDIDVALVTETHWKLEADPCTWSLSHWHCIHFASTQRKTAGMLLYVSKRVVSDTNIRFSSHLSGRLAHVRLYTHAPVDLILCYQHASSTSAEAETIRKRAHFWQKLASLLSSIPRRHLLLMLGDFNTPLAATSPAIHGPCVPEAKHSAPTDVPDFAALLEAHQLMALNTHRRDSVGTYK